MTDAVAGDAKAMRDLASKLMDVGYSEDDQYGFRCEAAHILNDLAALRSDAAGGDWKDDPSADERWNAGCDFAMVQLCEFLGVGVKSISWDAATETVDGDVQAVLGNILRAKFGEDWGPSDAAGGVTSGAATPQAYRLDHPALGIELSIHQPDEDWAKRGWAVTPLFAGAAQGGVDLDAILAGAQALANDVWHPPQPLRSLALYEQTKFKRQAELVLEAALAIPSTEGK